MGIYCGGLFSTCLLAPIKNFHKPMDIQIDDDHMMIPYGVINCIGGKELMCGFAYWKCMLLDSASACVGLTSTVLHRS